MQDSLGRPDDIIAVRKQAGYISGRASGDVENVPDGRDCGKGGVLEG